MRVYFMLIALVCLILFGILLTSGGAYVQTYGVAADGGALFVTGRASPMFLGLAVMLWLARDLPVGAARDAICIAMAVMWIGIAGTGVYHFASGVATTPILLAAMAETAIAFGFLALRRRA